MPHANAQIRQNVFYSIQFNFTFERKSCVWLIFNSILFINHGKWTLRQHMTSSGIFLNTFICNRAKYKPSNCWRCDSILGTPYSIFRMHYDENSRANVTATFAMRKQKQTRRIGNNDPLMVLRIIVRVICGRTHNRRVPQMRSAWVARTVRSEWH